MTKLLACGLSAEDLADIVNDVMEKSIAFRLSATPESVKNRKECWELRDDEDLSVRHMSDEEVRFSVIGDLLLAYEWTHTEKIPVDLTWMDLMRFTRSEKQRMRILDAIVHPDVQSYLMPMKPGDDTLYLNTEYLADACEYCGIFIDGVPIISAEPVICLSEEMRQRMADRTEYIEARRT